MGFGGLSESSDSVAGSDPQSCPCLSSDGAASFHSLRWADWAVSPGFCLRHVDDKDRGFFGVGLEFPGLGRACVAGGVPSPLGVEECPACSLPLDFASSLSWRQSGQRYLAFLLVRPSSPGWVLSSVQSLHHGPVALEGRAFFEGVFLSDGGGDLFLP